MSDKKPTLVVTVTVSTPEKLETYIIKDIPTLIRDVLVGHPRKEKNSKKKGVK